MRWIFLGMVWIAAEVGGYYGMRRLGLWRRWMGWSSLFVFGFSIALYGINIFSQSRGWLSHEMYLFFQRVGGILFLIWISLVLGKLMGGIVGLVLGKAVSSSGRDVKGDQGSLSCSMGEEGGRKRELTLSRRAFLQAFGGMWAATPLIGFGYGFWIGRYRFKLHEVVISLPDLPKGWEGLRLVQFSDLHAGSFPSGSPLSSVWEQIEQLKPDVLIFTGDWVNVYGWELEPHVADLARLTAPWGKWAVLGNHDYGDYARWPSEAEKRADHLWLRELIRTAGFTLLEDSVKLLDHSGEKLALIGVGNWSRWRRTQRYGSLEKAWAQVPPHVCSILLSHDPTHWEAQVRGQYPVSLTLSGHTHGLQVGVEWASWRFSPAAWLYDHWAGLYQEADQALYVNRGLGYIGLPARLGIWPEITLIHLTRMRKTVFSTSTYPSRAT
ncbi:MAG: metallophosphoesterase [Bacteroidia bacterium]|nr:metallophosphoesterase [Bacteroidia bacterium]